MTRTRLQRSLSRFLERLTGWWEFAVWWRDVVLVEAEERAKNHARVCGRPDHVVYVAVMMVYWLARDAFAVWQGEDDDDEG